MPKSETVTPNVTYIGDNVVIRSARKNYPGRCDACIAVTATLNIEFVHSKLVIETCRPCADELIEALRLHRDREATS